ncbi:ABC transporter permease [Alkalihalobacillus sp. LMS6]|uniref:ABC transporter permease n=1 Tax=Alkalihalobacillus sp. LMS6 TaxID=2924034 RepID=UPI0020D00E6C|nr:ABC transporter permease [Alkalihalobacillus sp. LMS6]UTR07152.1 ABC transporter permease [Alkalihalobacillus sp. LMS6]
MRTFWLFYTAEFKLSLREMSSFIFGLFLPIGLMALMGFLASSNEELTSSFAAVATIGLVATGVMSLPLSLSSYRERKVLKRYKVTPVSPSQLLLAHVAYCFSLSIISMLSVYLVATLGFGMEFVGSHMRFILFYVLVMISIHAIGMVIASLSPREKTTGAISSAIFFPMFLLSGATIPLSVMPNALESLAQIFPLTHGIQLLQTAVQQQPFDHWFSLFILLIITVIGVVVSIRSFKWE